MKTIASRTLASSPGQVWAALEREGALVVTKDGVPRSIMVPTSDATLLEDVQEIVFARARKAVREIRTRAAETGAADLTNLLVSGLLSPFGPPGRLVDALQAGGLKLATDDRIEAEYRDVTVWSPRTAWEHLVRLRPA